MPVYGDPDNSRQWTNANVYVSFNLDAPNPATIADDFGVDWDLVGLLDGNQGFTESTTETVTDSFAWGQFLLASRVSDQKTTKTFTALETNATTDRLQGIEDGVAYRRAPERCLVAFEKLDGSRGSGERRISAFQAEIRVNGDRQDTETGIQQIPFEATIFTGPEGELWTIQRGAASA